MQERSPHPLKPPATHLAALQLVRSSSYAPLQFKSFFLHQE